MICLIDSGLGGHLVYQELKKIRPTLRMICVADNKNFPYGEKSSQEILAAIREIEKGVKTFTLHKIFVACHTASIALDSLDTNLILITTTTKKMIQNLENKGSVAILGSTATINSGFYQELFKTRGFQKIAAFGLQDLIGLIENQEEDEASFLQSLEPVISFAPEILFLGSTHFPYIETLLAKVFPFAKILNPSTQFASEIASLPLHDCPNSLKEDLFITTKHKPKFLHTLQKNPINNLLKKDVKRV